MSTRESFFKSGSIRRLALWLAVLTALCGVVFFFSSRRVARLKKQQTQVRNLIPGLSEELTALAERQGSVGPVFIVELSGGSEEAKNLTGLMRKALGDGGWTIFKAKELDSGAGEYEPTHGIVCLYSKGQEKVADDLVSLLEGKGMRIKCRQRDDGVSIPMIEIQVGLR